MSTEKRERQNIMLWTEAVSKAEETPKRKANERKVNARTKDVRSGGLKNNAAKPRWNNWRRIPPFFLHFEFIHH
jgi:hypothetical protein